MLDRDVDLKAVAELVLEEDPLNATVITVAWAIREHLGWRDAKATINDACYALTLVGTPHALLMINNYRTNHAANVAAVRASNIKE